MVASSRSRAGSTPLRRITNLSQPGRMLLNHPGETSDEGEAQQEDSEWGAGLDVESRCRASPCSGDRYWQRVALRGGTTASRCGAGAAVCLLYRGLATYGSLAEKLWHRYRGDAVHGSVLAAGLRDLDRARAAGVSGERTAHQKPARAARRTYRNASGCCNCTPLVC